MACQRLCEMEEEEKPRMPAQIFANGGQKVPGPSDRPRIRLSSLLPLQDSPLPSHDQASSDHSTVAPHFKDLLPLQNH